MSRWSLLALLACTAIPFLARAAEPPEYDFPPGFQWGPSTAAYQAEGGNLHSDWAAWEALGKIHGKQKNGKATDHFTRFREDFALASQINTNAYRFSIEWSKIEPERDRIDEAMIAHYRTMILAMREQGLTPYLTLHHFTTPIWLMNFKDPGKGHFQTVETVKQFLEFVELVVARFGDLVDHYWTLNEPTILSMNGYLTGNFPPGVALPPGEVARALWMLLRNKSLEQLIASSPQGKMFVRSLYTLLLCHIRAYDLIKAKDLVDADGDGVAASVGLAHQYVALNAETFRAFPAFGTMMDRFNNDLLRTLKSGKVDIFGNIGLSPEEVSLPAATITNRMDVLGINYYTSLRFRDLLELAVTQFTGLKLGFLSKEKSSDLMGIKVRPDGLYRVLKETYANYGWGLMVTENGIATHDEVFRTTYLVAHLIRIARLLDEGVPVRGYFHWSLIDNFEWHLGTAPRFGLIEVDYTTFERRVKASALAYAEIAKLNAIPPNLLPSSR